MEEKNITLIKDTVEELLKEMGFSAQAQINVSQEDNDESIVCNISVGDDSNFLIGQHGINLQALQHVARLLVRRKTDDKVKFVIDVNGYRQQKNQSVVELAKQAAQEAVNEKRAVVMKPMSTYERRIVHMELSKNSSVITESIGEGEGRKVVVKPANTI